MKVLLSGGGTGGHVYPAIAIANKIKENHPEVEILFVGTEKGIEAEIVPKNGYPIKFINVKGFRRKIDFENVKRVGLLLSSMLKVKSIIKDFNPDIVIGTGGYVSGPVLYQASRLNKKCLIHEQNSYPGITNKLLSKKVDLVMTSFEDSHKRFPKEAYNKLTMTGNPVRDDIINCTKEDARKRLKIDQDKKMVLCYGGSGGSEEINQVIKPLLQELVDKDYAFIFATGKSYFEEYMKKLADLKLKPYQQIMPYLDDMANALSASDLVIGSAGAISLAEITAKGKASVIIPKAYTAENHQEYNAKSLEKAGASICITESELNEKSLREAVISILEDEDLLEGMSKASANIGKPEALDKIYNAVKKFI